MAVAVRLAVCCLLLVGCLGATLNRQRRDTFACASEATMVVTPYYFQPTTTHTCSSLISSIADKYDVEYRKQCQHWQGVYPDHIQSAYVYYCNEFSNGTSKYRAKVCCPGATTEQRCFTCTNSSGVYDSAIGRNTEKCNYEGETVACGADEVCMTEGKYYGTYYSYGTYTKTCAAKSVCEAKAKAGKCKNNIPDPSCTHCCDTPYCNFAHPMNYLKPGDGESDACSPNRCYNGGTCHLNNTVSSGYTCSCRPYAYGDRCQYTQCSTRPCENAGHCFVSTSSEPYYSCGCKAAWRGQNCSQACDLCDSSPCQNGGTCYDHLSFGYRCLCADNYVGDNCEKRRPILCSNEDHHYVYGTYVYRTSSRTCSSWLDYVEKNYISNYIGTCAYQMMRKYGNTRFKEGFHGHVGRMDATTINQCEKGDDTMFYKIGMCCPACLSNPCQNGGWCQQTDDDNYKCKCRYGYGGINCEHKQSVCYALGDPHYKTFDGADYSFQGPCLYTLVSVNDNSTQQKFEIFVKNEYRDGITTATFNKYAELVLGDTTVKLDRNKVITVDGQAVTAGTSFPGGTTLRNGRLVRVETDIGVVIESDGDWLLAVKVPFEYNGQLGGLCGNFDGTPDNDYITEDGTDVRDEDKRDSLLGAGWQENDESDPTCYTAPEDPADCDSGLVATLATNTYCGLLQDTSNSNPLAACIQSPDSMADSYYENCMFDTCINKDGDMKKVSCKSLEVFAAKCQDKGHVANWRGIAMCPLDCPAGTTFKYRTSACHATCANPNAPTQCGLPDTEACVCDDGKLMENDKCIAKEECGCLDENNNRFEIGESWLSPDCEHNVTCAVCDGENCSPIGQITEYATGGCDDEFQCQLNEDGAYACARTDCMDDQNKTHAVGSTWLSSDCTTLYECGDDISSSSVSACSGNEKCAYSGPDGYKCVVDSCLDSGIRYQFGERWMNDDCSEWRVCKTDGSTSDTKAGCTDDERCQLQGDLYLCIEKTCQDEEGETRKLGATWTSGNCEYDLTCTNTGVKSTATYGCQYPDTCEPTGDLAECVTPPSYWSQWSAWGACSERCSRGDQQRSRVCRPQGLGCEGDAVETRPCKCTANVNPNDCDKTHQVANVHGYLANPCDCTKFFQCEKVSGVWKLHSKQCGRCTEWDQSKSACIHSDFCDDDGNGQSTYGGGDICTNSVDGTVRKSEPNNNKKFMWKVHGNWIVMTCPLGTIFGPETCQCIHDSAYVPAVIATTIEITCLKHDTAFYGSQNIWLMSPGVKYVNGAAYFDGFSRVEIPVFDNRIDFKAFTVAFWYKRTGYSSGAQTLLTNGLCGVPASVEIISATSNSISATLKTQGGDASITGISALVNTWHHIALVYNGQTMMLYVDGQAFPSSQFVKGKIDQRHCPLVIGKGGPGMGFEGFIKKMCTYKNAFTAATIQSNYAAGHN